MTADERALAHEIGLTLRRLRRAQRLTQKALAERVAGGIDTTYIGKIERGDQLPSLKVLVRLSQTLNVSIGDFFYPSAPDRADLATTALHVEPLFQALRNRGIDGVALVRAILEAVGQHVLVIPPQHHDQHEPDPPPRSGGRPAIPLPMPLHKRLKD